MKTHKFARKTFYVDAVRVSEANIEEVASWCEGTVSQDEQGHTFLSVTVHRPLNERQTQAFIGDWVLFAGSGFKVYTPKAFDKSFEKVKTLTKEQADAAGIKVPHEPRSQPMPGSSIRVTKRGGGDATFDMARVAEAIKDEEPKEQVQVTQKGSGITATVPADEAPKKSKADIEAEKLINEVKALQEK